MSIWQKENCVRKTKQKNLLIRIAFVRTDYVTPLRQLVNTDHVVKNWILSTCFVCQATTIINISLFSFHGKCCMFCSQSQFTLVRKSFLCYRATLSQPSTGICGCKEEFSLEIFVAKKRFRPKFWHLSKGNLLNLMGHMKVMWDNWL